VRDADWRGGRVGRLASGQHAGRYVVVEEDKTRTGFHIWLLQRHPQEGSSDGWDVWADDEAVVAAWFSRALASVEWLG
jgi:hypothetical protein